MEIKKICKLSDKKILIKYSLPIICNKEIIKEINFSLRYRIDEEGYYKIIHPRERYFQLMSQSFGVKKKHISYSINTDFEIKTEDGNNISNIISKIEINDIDWYKKWKRNNKIESILK